MKVVNIGGTVNINMLYITGGMFSLGCENVRSAILPSSTKGKTTMCGKYINGTQQQ